MDETGALLEAARNTAGALRNSRLYRAYRSSRIRVEENPEAAFKLRNYKKTQAAYEYKRLRNEPVSFDEEKYISHLRAELMLIEETRAFLENEDAFLSVYAEIEDILTGACDIDMFN